MTAYLFETDQGIVDRGVQWRTGTVEETATLLEYEHYLGPLTSGKTSLVVVGEDSQRPVAAMIWRPPTSRRLPSDGTWLELSRWCLTRFAGHDSGSRMHAASLRMIRSALPDVTTLVSYSDPSNGHTGGLYRACSWRWCPTWHRLRPPPSGSGDWGTGRQAVKDRWIFPVRRDRRRAETLAVNDAAAIRRWIADAAPEQLKLAARSLAPDLDAAVAPCL